MKKRGKRLLIAAAAVAALLLALMGALQIYIRAEKEKRAEAPGNAETYDLSRVEQNADSPLKGKTIVFLGSSVTEGAAAEGQSFVELFEHRDGVCAIKEAKSGTTLTDDFSLSAQIAFGNGKSYVSRLKELDKNAVVDALVCQLSTNDATTDKPLGSVSGSRVMEDFDTDTVTGAMEYVIAYAKETWGCPVVFYTGSYYDNDNYAAMVGRLYDLQEKWDIGIIDLYTDEAFNDISQDDYRFYMYDEIHPTKAGYEEWWMPKMEEELEEILR